MNVSEFCIRRPVATILMSLALIFGGLFACRFLPVAALPKAEFPVINVSASLPGASPETMATSVATPLIKQFSQIAGIDSISTSNSLGSTSIAIQFALDRNIDAAAADVQAAIARTQRLLPDEHDDAAELPQGQSGRRADPHPRAQEFGDPADPARCLRRAGDLAVALDTRRCGAGAHLGQPEICGAHPGGSG